MAISSDLIINVPFIGGLDSKTLLVLISTFFITALFLSSRKRRKIPPGPIGLPIFGYYPFLRGEPFKALNLLGKKYGRIFSLYLGQNYVVVLNDWEAVKDAFGRSEVANKPPTIFDLMPGGFGFSDHNGIQWLEQRKFSMKAMKDLGLGRAKWEDLVQEEVEDLVKLIEDQGGKALELRRLLSSTFTSNIMTLLFGKRLPFNHPDAEYVSECVDSVTAAFPIISMGNFLPWLDGILKKFGVGDNSKFLKKMKDFGDYVRKVIEEITKDQSEDKDDFINEYRIQMQNNIKNNVESYFTERNLQGNIHSLIVGGGETIRTSLIWLLLAMAQHPNIQKKVQEELDRVVGKEGRIKWGERRKIPYTYASMMESLRWKTIIPVNTPHVTFEDIQVCGYDIPKGTAIIANNWGLHHDPRYWPEPEKFNPERFLLNQGTEINFKPESYVPFSYGKRNCPGEMVAVMELLIYFAALVQKFKILPSDEGLKYGVTLGLSYQATGLKLRFVPRD